MTIIAAEEFISTVAGEGYGHFRARESANEVGRDL
jgi:hypothetical protein